jgi:hypothetical protein
MSFLLRARNPWNTKPKVSPSSSSSDNVRAKMLVSQFTLLVYRILLVERQKSMEQRSHSVSDVLFVRYWSVPKCWSHSLQDLSLLRTRNPCSMEHTVSPSSSSSDDSLVQNVGLTVYFTCWRDPSCWALGTHGAQSQWCLRHPLCQITVRFKMLVSWQLHLPVDGILLVERQESTEKNRANSVSVFLFVR